MCEDGRIHLNGNGTKRLHRQYWVQLIQTTDNNTVTSEREIDGVFGVRVLGHGQVKTNTHRPANTDQLEHHGLATSLINKPHEDDSGTCTREILFCRLELYYPERHSTAISISWSRFSLRMLIVKANVFTNHARLPPSFNFID